MSNKLTGKQRRFIEAYLSNGRKGAEAYRTAYKSQSSPQVVAVKAAELLRNGKIAVIVAEADKRADQAIERVLDRYEVTKERVMSELARLGFSNMMDYMRVGPEGDPVLDFSAISRDQASALVEVTVEDFKDGRGEEARDVRRVKFKLADKRSALVDLGKELGMFVERKEIRTGVLTETPEDELDAIIRRAAAEAQIGLGPSGEGPKTRH